MRQLRIRCHKTGILQQIENIRNAGQTRRTVGPIVGIVVMLDKGAVLIEAVIRRVISQFRVQGVYPLLNAGPVLQRDPPHNIGQTHVQTVCTGGRGSNGWHLLQDPLHQPPHQAVIQLALHEDHGVYQSLRRSDLPLVPVFLWIGRLQIAIGPGRLFVILITVHKRKRAGNFIPDRCVSVQLRALNPIGQRHCFNPLEGLGHISGMPGVFIAGIPHDIAGPQVIPVRFRDICQTVRPFLSVAGYFLHLWPHMQVIGLSGLLKIPAGETRQPSPGQGFILCMPRGIGRWAY